MFCTAKVCVSEGPAQVGTHSFSDVEYFARIRKMSNNVKLSPWTTVSMGERITGENVILDFRIDMPHQI